MFTILTYQDGTWSPGATSQFLAEANDDLRDARTFGAERTWTVPGGQSAARRVARKLNASRAKKPIGTRECFRRAEDCLRRAELARRGRESWARREALLADAIYWWERAADEAQRARTAKQPRGQS